MQCEIDAARMKSAVATPNPARAQSCGPKPIPHAPRPRNHPFHGPNAAQIHVADPTPITATIVAAAATIADLIFAVAFALPPAPALCT
jgi:hypothetical protein